MRIEILDSAEKDLLDGFKFYERQRERGGWSRRVKQIRKCRKGQWLFNSLMEAYRIACRWRIQKRRSREHARRITKMNVSRGNSTKATSRMNSIKDIDDIAFKITWKRLFFLSMLHTPLSPKGPKTAP